LVPRRVARGCFAKAEAIGCSSVEEEPAKALAVRDVVRVDEVDARFKPVRVQERDLMKSGAGSRRA